MSKPLDRIEPLNLDEPVIGINRSKDVMQTVLVLDELTETTEAAAPAVVRSKAERVGVAAKDSDIDSIRRRHAAELEAFIAHSREVDALDEAMAARIALIDAATAILGAEFDASGQSETAIRRLVAVQKLGEAKLAGKDDAYVQIVFDTLLATIVTRAPAQISTAGVQTSYAIAAYNLQMGVHNQLDSAAHGHGDIAHAIRLGFGWVKRGLQAQNHHQSRV